MPVVFSLKNASIFSSLALSLFVTACGDKRGNTVGKDPRQPVSLQPRQESPSQGTPHSSQSSSGGQSQTAASNGSLPPDPVKVCQSIFGSVCTAGGNTNPGNEPSPAATPAPAPALATLTINVKDLHNLSGNFCLSIFNSPDGYPDSAEKAIYAECFDVIDKNFSITVKDVAPGRYAVAGWHDENKDKELNKNIFGIPKEGLSFSENGKPRLSPPPGPPSFDSIAFDVGTQDRSTDMKTSYLLDL